MKSKHLKHWIPLIALLIISLSIYYWFVRTRIYEIDQPITASPADCQSVLRFAVIGDYGDAGKPVADVAEMINRWQIDLIVTAGDNNYPEGEASTIDRNIGQYFAAYIYPYKGEYGRGDSENRFFPVLGNHDWIEQSLQPYYDYFTLPGNERYYNFRRGPVDFFMLDSDPHEPDGRTQDSDQATWFKDQAISSTAPWKLVFMHHPAYGSSVQYGEDPEIQWPFASIGIDAVFSGHAHLYERLNYDGILYFINGLGGRWKTLFARHTFKEPRSGSIVRYNQDYGAQLVTADENCINFSFINRNGVIIDSITLEK